MKKYIWMHWWIFKFFMGRKYTTFLKNECFYNIIKNTYNAQINYYITIQIFVYEYYNYVIYIIFLYTIVAGNL